MPATLLPETQRLLAAAGVLGLYLAATAATLLRARRRRRRRQGDATPADADHRPAVLVAHASQTGFAEELAWRAAAALRAGPAPVRIARLGGLGATDLATARAALFVIS